MQKYSRILATFLVLATTVGCLRVCPPPQTLVSLDWQVSRCQSGQVLTRFGLQSTGLQLEILRAQRNVHVCLIVEESH